MPHTPVYGMEWLAARERARQPRTIVRDIPYEPSERPIVDGEVVSQDPIAEARRYLESAPDYSDIASIPERLAEIGNYQRPSLRGLTEPLARAGGAAITASLPTAFVPGGQGIAAGLGTVGTVAQVPDMLRRALDDDPTNDPSPLEGGFAALGLLPGVGRAFRGTPGKGFPRRVLGAPAGQEIPFRSTQPPAMNPNQALRVAREIAEETEEPLEAILTGGRKAGINRASAEALAKLAASGSVGETARLAKEAEQLATFNVGRKLPALKHEETFRRGLQRQLGRSERGTAKGETPFQAMSRKGQFRGDRTVGTFKEPPGGLSDVPGMKPYPMPSDPDSIFARLARLARIRARGQSFRKGTPLSEDF